MAHQPVKARSTSGLPLMSTTTLALWRVKHTWGMLFFTGLGMLAAVMLVCSVPLYSRMATTTGLRSVLHATRDSSTITLHITTDAIASSSVNQLQQQLDGYEQSSIAPYIGGAPQFSIQTQGLSIVSPKLANSGDTIGLFGATMGDASHHVKLIAGRLPAQSSKTIEIAITPETAQSMGVHVGSTITIHITGFLPAVSNGEIASTSLSQNVQLHVVGLIAATITKDVFWHGFHLYSITQLIPHSPPLLTFGALASNEAILNTVDAVAGSNATVDGNPPVLFTSPISELYWYYQLDTAHLDISQLNDLIVQIKNWNNKLDNAYAYTMGSLGLGSAAQPPYVQNIASMGDAVPNGSTPSVLQLYQSRAGVASIPVSVLLLQVIGLILFFIALMAELLIERQADAIAILGSRGANKPQIFGAFLTQSIGLGIIALIAGPLLAMLVVTLIAQRTLVPIESDALNVIWGHPLAALLSLRGYALVAVLVAVGAMTFATYRAVGFNVLSVRREAARAKTRPLWQRLNLDIVAALVALTGYGISVYLNSVQGLDSQTQVLVQSPLAIIAPTFLLIAGILIVLRLFPLLLRAGAHVATRGRGASAMLALGQMARAPRQSIRMTLLLALTSAFAIFALVFSASQTQRISDLTNYQVGADFSGPLPGIDSTTPLNQQTSIVDNIRGVTSATLGYGSVATASAGTPFQLQLRAVDANNFAQTAIWTQQNSSQSLATLMHQLIAQRATATHENALPALIDAETWNQLHLTPGEHFRLAVSNPSDTGSGTITCIAFAEVQRIPTTNNAGILVDYESYSAIYQNMFGIYLPLNYLWVKTSNDPTLVQHVRDALTSQQPIVNPLADRRALVAQLGKDPLYLDLVGELALGASTAMLLALLGNLLASWLNARNRQTSFAVLRALGTSSQQVVGVLSWEQGITYLTSILLGIGFGAMLSATVIPALVFSSVPTNDTSNSQFYALQHTIPVQMIVPLSLVLALIVLVILCIVALGMMVHVVTNPLLAQALRLNED